MFAIRRSHRIIQVTTPYSSTRITRSQKRLGRQLGSYTVEKKIAVYEDPSWFKRAFNEELAKYAAITGKHMLVVDGPSANSSRVAKQQGVKPSKIHAVTDAKDYDQLKASAPIGIHTYKANVMTMFQTDFGDNTYPIGQIMDTCTGSFGVMYFDLMCGTPNNQHRMYCEYRNLIDTLVLYKYLEKDSVFALTTSLFAMQKVCQKTYCTTEEELAHTLITLFAHTSTSVRVLTCKKYRGHMCFIKILIR
jgi:hypothetical protein